MKTTLILWSILLTQLSFSQLYTTACDAEHSPISTDFQNPFYPQELLPYGTTGSNFQNGLDWNSYSGFNCEDMSFAGIPLVGMTALTSTQTSGGYYAYIYASASAISRKHLNTEGWELVAWDLGFDENMMPENPAAGNVHFILYNKYTSILRIFVAGKDQNAYNSARISIFTRSQSSNPLFIAQPSLLLEKTEELTLYILQLEERLHKLETQE